MGRWIKLHDKILDSEVWHDPKVFRLWSYLLLKANYKRRKLSGGKVLQPGQLITGRYKASADTGLTEHEYRRCLRVLEELGKIRHETATRGTLVTIVRYEAYQSKPPASAPPPRKRKKTATGRATQEEERRKNKRVEVGERDEDGFLRWC